MLNDSINHNPSISQDIPAKAWRVVLVRAWNEVNDNNIWLAAGGVTYAVLAAMFPGLAALVSIYGLAMNPHRIEAQMNGLTGLLPQQTQQIITQELHQLVMAQGALSYGATAGMLLALAYASRGMSGLMTALNIAYEAKERRGFFKYNLVALVLTLGLIFSGIVMIVLVAGFPAAVQFLGLQGVLKWLLLTARWPFLIGMMMVGLAVLYRFAPSHDRPQWRWITLGAVVATLLWLIASIAFSAYVADFANYNKTYGSLGGVLILLTWLYIAAFAVLFGAVINAQAERQTV